MSSRLRRQEIAEREAQMVAEARRQVSEHGYFGLNMDKVAAAVGLSKPTLYQHFRTKEDLLLGVATDSFRVRHELFVMASRCDATPRARMHAIGVADRVFARRHPEHEACESVAMAPSFIDKASPERRQELDEVRRKCFEHCVSIAVAGIAAGDLDPAHRPEAVTASLWSMAVGLQQLARAGVFDELQVVEPFPLLRENESLYCDALGWRPLSSEFDYVAFERGVEERLDRDYAE